MAAATKSTPRDAQVMTAILKDMGVTEYEPRIINQMLEFTYRYVTDILDDAKVYSTHANKKNIDTEDVKLAVQCRLDHSYTTPPPRDLLMEVARHKNSQPLPLIKPYTGPKLPPDRYCLSSANYKLKTAKKSRVTLGGSNALASSLMTPTRVVPHNAAGKSTPTITLSGGALSMANRSVAQPTVTIVTRPASTAASTVPTPIVRFTPSSSSSAVTGSKTPNIISQPASVVNTSINPLKRKLDDDDYDQP